MSRSAGKLVDGNVRFFLLRRSDFDDGVCALHTYVMSLMEGLGGPGRVTTIADLQSNWNNVLEINLINGQCSQPLAG